MQCSTKQWFHFSTLPKQHWCKCNSPNTQSRVVSAQTHCIYIMLFSLYGARAFDIIRPGWYKQASPKLHRGFSSSFFAPPPLPCVSATQLSGPRKGLFRHYLSRLVFPSTKQRMNESNPSVFDPRSENVLLFSLWWWGPWKAFSSSFFPLFFFCGWNFSMWSYTTLWLKAEFRLRQISFLFKCEWVHLIQII